jgi:hypothetical protein
MKVGNPSNRKRKENVKCGTRDIAFPLLTPDNCDNFRGDRRVIAYEVDSRKSCMKGAPSPLADAIGHLYTNKDIFDSGPEFAMI